MSLGHSDRGAEPAGVVATVNVHSNGTGVKIANSSTPSSDQTDTARPVSANRMPIAPVSISTTAAASHSH